MTIIRNDHQLMYDTLKDKKSWDYIDTLGFRAQDIEESFMTMTLDVRNKKKDQYIENQLHIAPSMVGTFYYYLLTQKRIPSQYHYIKFYCYVHKDWVLREVGKEHYEGFIGRLSRFYPSMLRDIHFYHVLKESKKFERVLFTLKHDLEAKVDCFLRRNGKWYGIQMRTRTRRSDSFYKKKDKRSPIYVKAQLIDLPIDLTTAKSIQTKKDDIKLYDERHIRQVISCINKQLVHEYVS